MKNGQILASLLLRFYINKTFYNPLKINNKKQEGLSETRPHLEGIATITIRHFSRSVLVGNKTSFRRDCDPISRLLSSSVSRISSETRPHLEGIATIHRDPPLAFEEIEVGNKTSFRRDCDLTIDRIKIKYFFFFFSHNVGNKTSFRRDCDSPFGDSPTKFQLSETRPHLEGIATVKGFIEGFALFVKLVGNKTSFRRDCDLSEPSSISFLDFCQSETRPHLEGIAT